jgi:lon-related putative ATP-dependent protease
MIKKLNFTELREKCDPNHFVFRSTEDIEPLSGIIGQERAVSAMDFGLRIEQKGYNIYMTGLTGTGKTSYARSAVNQVAAGKPVPGDIIYVYNFSMPDKPLVISLPAGKGHEFSTDMEKLITEIRQEVSKLFDAEDFENQKKSVLDKYQKASFEMFSKIEELAKSEGFMLQKSAQGIATLPLVDGKPMSQEDYKALSNEYKEAIEQKSREIQAKIDEALRKVRFLDREAQKELQLLEKDMALSIINPVFEEVAVKYKDFEDIIIYLKSVKEDIVKNLSVIRGKDETGEMSQLLDKRAANPEDFYVRYKINVFVDNRATKGAPVIFETSPTYYNLFGKIEGRAQFGAVTTDFTMIKSGAVHRANGGYLVLQASDLFKDPYAWDALKRTLNNEEARVENIGEQYRAVPTVTLKPQHIPIKIKVILIGSPQIYSILNQHDEDFRKLFKIKVDFDVEMDRTPENMKAYASFICNMCRQQNLIHFTPSGVASVIDYSSRLAESKEKLSTRFNEIAEVLYEASAWAKIENSPEVSESHVEKAINEKVYRSNRVEEKMFSMIERGEIMVDTDGLEVGQVNGLSVLDTGDYVFGQPSRITARTYLGDAGVVNIEREARMSGRIHDKAVMILTGYLGEKYSKDMPLTISASIAFEQNYGGIEGDSATCAELIALLSSISGIPVRQDLAITGSLNQHGKAQPVGGTTYKVEGFFHACKINGLTGKQGVVIPHQNVINLMLKPEVVEAVREGKFHIYSVETIDDAIEIMTGVKPNEFHQEVSLSLKKMAEAAKGFAKYFF